MSVQPGRSPFDVVGSVESAESAIVVHVPHSSTYIPPELRRTIRLDDDELAHELARVTDHRTDELFAPVIELGVGFVNRMSRLVFDPERFRDDTQEVMAARGVGAVYERTTDGRPLRVEDFGSGARERILDDLHLPYSEAFSDLVDAVLDRFGSCLIIDAHSYPSEPFGWELQPDADRPQVALGTHPFHTPLRLVNDLETVLRSQSVDHARDVPFGGTYVPLWHLERDERVSSVMIEVRRDTYCDEATGEPGPEFSTVQSWLRELGGGAVRFLRPPSQRIPLIIGRPPAAAFEDPVLMREWALAVGREVEAKLQAMDPDA